MKIALLQCNTVTGDVAGNAERILAAVREAAAQGADLCVTPELALCGVAPGSYLRAEDFAEGCKAGLQMLADALQDGPPLLVGAPVASVYASGLLSNAAILVQKGRWSVVSRKVYQTYGQDSEARFFDRGVSCGILALDGWRLGVVLCQESATEDGAFWKTQYASGHNPLMELVQRGVDAIVHMAAVPFSKGVQRLSEQMLSQVAARHHVHLFSVNMVGGNDSREIAAEIYTAQKDTGERVSHIVLMGIGEPLHNFNNVMDFLEIISCPEGVNIGMRNISLSTCGLVPKIDELAKRHLQLTLSVSLHAPDNKTRSGMMPVNDAFPLEQLIPACRRYQKETGRRISFEYSMVRGVNDSSEMAQKLANWKFILLTRGIPTRAELV